MSTTDLLHKVNEWSPEVSSKSKYALSGRNPEDFPQDVYASPALLLFQRPIAVIHLMQLFHLSTPVAPANYKVFLTSLTSDRKTNPDFARISEVELGRTSAFIGAFKDAVHRQEFEQGSRDGPTPFDGRTEVLPKPEDSHGLMAVLALDTDPNNTRAQVMAQCELPTGAASSTDPSPNHTALVHVMSEPQNQQSDLRNVRCGCDRYNSVKNCPEHEYELEGERLALQELRDAFDPSENLPEDEDAFLAFVAQRIRDLSAYHSPARAKM
ncbi:hypothetical protein SISNIDRAFT_466984 [Sistotremastrum niveocremeum HHB9708]|uniref:Uncharacterized protein n=1 Tax=Sistotremastrum niveocremeum HHB9708 TaxID=1314777 RepID=A0A164T6P9_9AGAM|nr:hypothetical protein SISNIDRAFT_466984 [Sistotremastrum niveocremeum HHB9708]